MMSPPALACRFAPTRIDAAEAAAIGGNKSATTIADRQSSGTSATTASAMVTPSRVTSPATRWREDQGSERTQGHAGRVRTMLLASAIEIRIVQHDQIAERDEDRRRERDRDERGDGKRSRRQPNPLRDG